MLCELWFHRTEGGRCPSFKGLKMSKDPQIYELWMNQKDLPFYISFLHNTFNQVLCFNLLSTIVMILIKLWSSNTPSSYVHLFTSKLSSEHRGHGRVRKSHSRCLCYCNPGSFGNACLQHGKSPTHCVLIKLSHLLALVNITVEPTNIHMSLKLIVCSFLVLGRFLNFPNNTYCLIFEYMLKVHLKPQCNIFQELERYLTVYCTLSRTIIQSVCTAKNRNMHGNYHCFKSLSWSNTNINLSLGKLSK